MYLRITIGDILLAWIQIPADITVLVTPFCNHVSFMRVSIYQRAIIKTIEDEDSRRGDGTSLGPTLVGVCSRVKNPYLIFPVCRV